VGVEATYGASTRVVKRQLPQAAKQMLLTNAGTPFLRSCLDLSDKEKREVYSTPMRQAPRFAFTIQESGSCHSRHWRRRNLG